MKRLTIFLLMCISTNLFSQHLLESKYDVSQYILDLEINSSNAIINGNVTINAKVIANCLDTIVFDLIDTIVPYQTYMVVDSIFVDGVINSFQHHDDFIFIPVPVTYNKDYEFSVQIYYHGRGRAVQQTNYNGISRSTYAWVTHTYTYSEPAWSKIWWPCKQVLNDKADSITFYITTDSTNISGTNGLLKSTEYLPNGKVRYKWVTNYPTDFYLVSFVVGPMTEYNTYAQLPNTQDSIFFQNLLFPNASEYSDHLKAIEKTKQLIYLYSELIGEYPFKDEKYGYCVVGSPLGAMENQTMCTIGYNALDTTATNYYGYYFWYVAHELGHQWFGDYVTCSKWNYIWLNEGFASYMEYVAIQNLESQANADLWIQNAHDEVKTLPGGSVYVPDSLASDENNILDYRLEYKKGSSIIHTLRYEINNDTLFFNVLKNYLSTYAYSVASADDFKQIAETTTGIDFTDFFNQWYYGEGYPIFNISWSQDNDTLTIESNQTTSTSVTTLFKTHFDIKINHSLGDTTLRLFQETNYDIFKIYFPNYISSIEFDPELWLIEEHNLIPVGINSINDNEEIKIFPNPTTGKITIDAENVKSIEIINIEGKRVFKGTKTKIDLSSFPKGIYIINVLTGKETITRKIIKQ